MYESVPWKIAILSPRYETSENHPLSKQHDSCRNTPSFWTCLYRGRAGELEIPVVHYTSCTETNGQIVGRYEASLKECTIERQLLWPELDYEWTFWMAYRSFVRNTDSPLCFTRLFTMWYFIKFKGFRREKKAVEWKGNWNFSLCYNDRSQFDYSQVEVFVLKAPSKLLLFRETSSDNVRLWTL